MSAALNLVKRYDRENDPTHRRLRIAIEKRKKGYFWTPADAVTFIPYVLPTIYGDGRVLFTLSTINQRPRYWVIRACSTWGCDLDREDAPGPNFGDQIDDILTELEEAFGKGRCDYSGNSLFWPKKERVANCQCEECSEGRFRARWPIVDDEGGCSWSRIDWPKGFATTPNPLSWRGNLLCAGATP